LSKHVNDVIIPKVKNFFSTNNIQEATDLVHEYERKLRLTEDTKTLSNLFEIFVNGLVSERKFTVALNELTYFGKKKHILESSLKSLVASIFSHIAAIEDPFELESLLVSFIQITDGKIYAEIDHAKAVLKLVYIYESRGELGAALDLIIKSHVETYANLEFTTKTEFILEQMRLSLACNENTRFELVSKKVSQKFIKECEDEKYLMMYHDYLIKFHVKTSKFFECAKSFDLLLKCKTMQNNSVEKNKILKLLTAVLSLSEYEKPAIEMMEKLNQNEDMVSLPNYLNFMKDFTGGEIIQLSHFNATFKDQIFTCPTEPFHGFISSDNLQSIIQLVERRLNERNMVIISRVFCSLTLQRAAEILEMSQADTEDLIVDMITANKICGLINRMGKINIVFKELSDCNTNLKSLDDWSKGLESMMKLVENTSYMISNEEMINVSN